MKRLTKLSLAFSAAFSACQARDSGEILKASWPDGNPAAMVFLVWGHGRMYYLLTTRVIDPKDNGSVPLLIWSAIKRAHERRLIFDLDDKRGVLSWDDTLKPDEEKTIEFGYKITWPSAKQITYGR